MDEFMDRTSACLEPKHVHLIGVTSMLLASKMEEIIPFKISVIADKMTHGKIKSENILLCEEEMLRTLDFQLLSKPSLFVFLEFLMVKLSFHMSPQYEDIVKVIRYISKMVMHDYQTLTSFPLRYIASSCLYLAFKIIE